MKDFSDYIDLKKDVSSINNLLSQLNPEAPTLTVETLRRFLSNRSLVMFAIIRNKRKDDQIIGMASLSTAQTFFGLKGIIEDVVVDKDYRGQGLGRGLIAVLIEQAKKNFVKRIELTSQSSRVNANNLYKSLGFEKRETNVYTLKL
jgi:phosphinothricin acetyltransferase